MKNFLFKEIVVWLLIAVGVLIFFIFAYIIGTNTSQFFSALHTYKTVLQESTGIYVGTKVTIHGKSTGNVYNISLLPDGKVEVNFTVKRSHSFSITDSSVVHLKTAGALGDRFINIITKDLSSPQRENGSVIPYQPTASLLSVLTSADGDAQRSIQDIIKKVDTILQNINENGAVTLLSSKQQEDLTQILKSTKNILQKVESGQGTLGALVNDRALYNRLLILLGQRPTNNYLKDLSKRSKSSNK